MSWPKVLNEEEEAALRLGYRFSVLAFDKYQTLWYLVRPILNEGQTNIRPNGLPGGPQRTVVYVLGYEIIRRIYLPARYPSGYVKTGAKVEVDGTMMEIVSGHSTLDIANLQPGDKVSIGCPRPVQP